jgi:hypothetical protein
VKKLPAELVGTLAALLGPMVFLSAAHDLYLRNQDQLYYTYWILWPFWAAAGVLWLIGVVATLLSERGRWPALEWACLLVGPGLLLHWLVRNVPWETVSVRRELGTPWAFGAMLIEYFAVLIVVSRRWHPRVARAWLAVAALALTLGEAHRLTALRTGPTHAPAPSAATRPLRQDLGNVYHLVLDSFPAELFEQAQPAPPDEWLQGFVSFELVSPCPVTYRAVRALFAYSTSCCAVTWPGMPMPPLRGTGTWELPLRLRSRGYQLEALVPPEPLDEAAPLFDRYVLHESNVPGAALQGLAGANGLLFRRLWVNLYVPDCLLGLLDRTSYFGVPGEALRSVRGADLASYRSAPISCSSLSRFLAQESRQPARGRYVYVHLWLPHIPFVLREDCSPLEGNERSDLLAQSRCALRRARDFVETLKRLGRFEESTIIIQGDHGADFAWRGGRVLEGGTARGFTILLIKPPGAAAPFRRQAVRASMCDVAPTLAVLLGLPPIPNTKGRILDPALPAPAGRH